MGRRKKVLLDVKDSDKLNVITQQLNDISEEYWGTFLERYKEDVLTYNKVLALLVVADEIGALKVDNTETIEFLKYLSSSMNGYDTDASGNCLILNSEEMAAMMACSLPPFDATVCHSLIKARAYRRHLFNLVKSSVSNGKVQCHDSIKDALLNLPL